MTIYNLILYCIIPYLAVKPVDITHKISYQKSNICVNKDHTIIAKTRPLENYNVTII